MSSSDRSEESTPLNTQFEQKTNYKKIAKYEINRNVLTHDDVIRQTGYSARDKSIPSGIRRWWNDWSMLQIFIGLLPILEWLPNYSLKNDLIGDMIAGFTVAIMNIPHGIAYGILAGVGPGNGLYMAIFPVLVYIILGTSRHISIGTFAVISMMTLQVVQTRATTEDANSLSGDVITPLEVVTALAFATGIIHLLMACFRLGTLSSLLSRPLVNGFTAGAAIHVVTNQLKEVLGVTVTRYKGAFKIIKTVYDIGKETPSTNMAAFIFSLCVLLFLIISNDILKPQLSKYCRLPLPVELIAVVGGTLISIGMQLNEKYGINLVGDIPKGLPVPKLPRMDLVPVLFVDAIAIAIVSYSIIMSMGLTISRNHKYEIRANQELIAVGVGNVVCGFFSCIPMACSLSRSIIQEKCGGVTQIASLFSALLLTATLLWIGPFFSALPRCVLAVVIIVALKPMFTQIKDLRIFFKQGKLECLTWVLTFFSVVIIDIDYGLLIGVAISLLTFYIKGLKPYSSILGYIPAAPGIYVDLRQHNNAMELPHIKIFRYYSSLNFATSLFFRRTLYAQLFTEKHNEQRNPLVLEKAAPEVLVLMDSGNQSNGEAVEIPPAFEFLIVDMSMLGHVDIAGATTISDIMKDMKKRNVRVLLAAPTDRVYDTLVHSMALSEGPFDIFPTLHDAVSYAQAVHE